MEKRHFEEAEMEVVVFDAADIICASGDCGAIGDSDDDETPRCENPNEGDDA